MRAFLKAIIPEALLNAINEWRWQRRQRQMHLSNERRSAASVFSEIYGNNLWGGRPNEFNSGWGTHSPAAELYLKTVNDFITENKIRSVVDVGCGDYSVGMGVIAESYTGVDVVPVLIERNRREFGSADRKFVCADAAGQDELPDGDLCLIRQVLQHLSNAQIVEILRKTEKFRYRIITEHHVADVDFEVANVDKVHGGDTRLFYGSAVYLDKPPFNRHVRLLAEYPGDLEQSDFHARGPIRTYVVEGQLTDADLATAPPHRRPPAQMHKRR